ncbi:MAG: hypothetical protein K6U03_00675 [Firmicutes bacterium]|nr:hypothetical protein [Bacillota bacterium]
MNCPDCGHKVVSAGLVYCPKCSAKLSTRVAGEFRHLNVPRITPRSSPPRC